MVVRSVDLEGEMDVDLTFALGAEGAARAGDIARTVALTRYRAAVAAARRRSDLLSRPDDGRPRGARIARLTATLSLSQPSFARRRLRWPTISRERPG